MLDQITCVSSTFWDGVTGWYTPGWGNLFTVTLAAAAIGVNAWYNRRTLRNANEINQRTLDNANQIFNQGRVDANQKFVQARIDARNDKLRAEIAEFLDAVSERRSQWAVFTHRRSELTGQSLRAAWSELLSDSYTRIGTHSLTIEILTDDPGIVDPVRRIVQICGLERQTVDTALEAMSSPTPPADTSGLQEAFAQLLVIDRSNAIGRERQALIDYVMGEWAQQNR